ncbi:MAG: antitoxin [Propionibacteriaceae bacterium]|nr:antitoxin [Propionibacteriaceae bacterium]
MRTTIDLDERAVAAGRAKAAAERTSLGRAISELVLQGLLPTTNEIHHDFPTFPPVEDHIITDELVAAYRDA